MFKTENLEISQLLEKKSREEQPSKGIKRSATDGVVRKGTILDIFKKRSRTEGEIEKQ